MLHMVFNFWHFDCVLIVFIVETIETPNDGGGENRQVNGEAQDQCVSQDAEMEEGMHSLSFILHKDIDVFCNSMLTVWTKYSFLSNYKDSILPF